MTASTTKSANPKVNKGGRPRKTPSSHGKLGIRWKIITDPPGGLNHYEISSQGEVRRKLKDERYVPVKPWVTGGPYAAVYFYGFRNATRNRKKVYIHRLVAEHFVRGRKKGEVVHHKQGPANNTAGALEWVSVEENAKARKYFNPDGTRKTKVKGSVPRPNALKQMLSPPPPPPQKPAAKAEAPKSAGKAKPPPPKPGKQKPVQKPVQKAKPIQLPGKQEILPGKDVFIPRTETIKQKIRWLTKNNHEFSRAYRDTRDVVKHLNSGNLAALFKQATGKGLHLDDKRSPYQWKTKLLSALHAIKTRLKT